MNFDSIIDVIKKIFFISGLSLIIASNVIQIVSKKSIIPSEKDLFDVLPDAHNIIGKQKPVNHYEGFAEEKKRLYTGVAFLSSNISPHVKGFVDELAVLVGISKSGKIVGVKLLEYKETPSYMNVILKSNLLNSFIDKEITTSFSDINAITGATVTSKAIIEDIQTASATVARQVLKLSVTGHEEKASIDKFFTFDLFVFICIILFSLLSFYNKKQVLVRDICLVLSVLVLGVYYNTFLYLGTLTNLLNLKIPPLSHPTLFILIVFTLFSTLFISNIFCSHLCPFGSLSELLYKFFPKKWQPSVGLVKKALSIKYFFLFICIVMIFGFNNESFTQIEPFAYLFSWIKGSDIGIMWVYIGTLLIVSAFFNRFFCRIFCPTGLCLLILSKVTYIGRRGKNEKR